MVCRADYRYGGHVSSYRTKKAERELRNEREEKRKAQAAHNKQAYQETFMRGGVVFNTAQVKSHKPTKVKAPDGTYINGFEVIFNNGMTVNYADQTDKRIRSNRNGEVSAIFANDSHIDVYNVNVGSLQGTENSENIRLRICYNFNIDGNGGNDSYTSEQRYEVSNNSYTMHIGDVYQKQDMEIFDIKDERDAATLKPFVIKDNYEHKMHLEKLKEIDNEINALAKAKKRKPLFDVQPIKPKFIDENFKTQVLERSQEAMKQIEREQLLQKAEDFIFGEITEKMYETDVKNDPSLSVKAKESEEPDEFTN